MNARLRTSLGLVVLLSAATACPSDPDPVLDNDSSGGMESDDGSTGPGATSMELPPGTSADESSSGDDPTTGAPDDPGCDCVGFDDPFLIPGCDFEELCEPVVLTCTEPVLADCSLATMTVTNPEVLPCHHDVLVGGDPAMSRWELPNFTDPGVSGQRGWALLLEDGRVITWQEAWGSAYAFSDATLWTRRDAAYFDDCMTLATPEETFACLFDAGDREVTVCEEAYEVPLG